MVRRDVLKYTLGLGSLAAINPRNLISGTINRVVNPTTVIPHVAVFSARNISQTSVTSFLKGLRVNCIRTNYSTLTLPANNTEKKTKIENYLAQHSPDIILLLSSVDSDSTLIRQVVANKIPIVNLSLGEKIHNALSDSQAYTLQSWQSNYTLGNYAHTSAGKNAVVITSQIDSGYDCFQSLIHGYTEPGGTIERIIIADADTSISGLEHSQLSTTVFNAFQQPYIDCILLHCTGTNLEKSLSFVAQNNINLPIFASYQSISEATTTVKKLLDKVPVTTVVPDLFQNTSSRFTSNAISSWNLFELLGNNIAHIIANTQPQTITSELMQVNTQNKFIVSKIDNQFFNGRGFPTSVISRLSTETQDVVYALKGIHTMQSGNLSPYLMA
ncbi:MAG: hypothetical protein U0Y96_16670 [Candidatus Kapaibacterium sp.]|nr:hypothetical protein [Bacteroidota bacterium]